MRSQPRRARVGADAGDRRLDPRDVTPQRRRVLGDLALETAVRERRGQTALRLDLLEDRPTLVAERLGQRLETARAGGRIVDEAEVGFAQEDELAVAREPPREAAGQTHSERVRQHADAVGAAEARRKGGDRSAQHVQVRVARVIIRQALSAWTWAERGARPQASSTRAQTMRSARNLASSMNSSASADRRKAIMPRLVGRNPASPSARRRLTPAPSAKASS